jgi:hypothetical protein
MAVRALWAAMLVWAAGCGGPRLDDHLSGPPGSVAGSLAELARTAPVIVLGSVTRTSPGRTVEGPEPTPFEDVEVTVERALKGTPGASVLLEQVAATVPGLPPMRRGERYLLFVRPQMGDVGPGRFVLLSQGRLQLAGGRVRPITPGPVATEVQGLTEAELIARVQAAVAAP